MLRFIAWIAAFLILIGSVWSQEDLFEEKIGHSIPKFGFIFLEPFRKYFCNNFCNSSSQLYIMNFACAIKCPELYLPHQTSTMAYSTESSTSSMITTQSSMNNTK
ncbi:uncharacterized protein LOC102680722 [Apis dorsata]|uniref:uncharacterized protein LOC102680722 n=1 Tax=Apis dorsata TaxID=7462 RepID=UPI0003DF7D04|nr:uncharacterized protein LOC102680722 [Apis dorsata]